ncbi:MAG TPA: F0F1 ATP synthase subunit delta [Rhodanobacteraceae bacterium]|nr:F0F1 ATP synthase subunit delta [Rhodanobacteraceae bacterium]
MEPITLARPYARAAFELASEQRALGEWAQRLAFAAQVAGDAQTASLFGDPRIAPGQLASLFLPEGEPADSMFARFIGALAENHRLHALPEIAALFEQLKRDAERVLKVRVTSAVPIDAIEAAQLRDALKRRFDREIELEQSLDPSMLGGAVIDAGEMVIDGSVRGRLARLGTALAQ